MKLSELFEALKPSEYRPLVKGWDKERYAAIFKSDKYKHDKNGYRVFLPLDEDAVSEPSKVQRYITDELVDYGYEVTDYRKGLLKNKKNNQTIKIGKVLTKLDRDDLLQMFTTDKAREAVRNEYIVVISRHPYDIAGMSTGRGWRSCMNLHDGIHKEFVPMEIKAGSVVAYVTSKTDPDLKNPTGRIMIKPFVNFLDPDNKDNVYFGMEDKVYGTNVRGFRDTVKEWVDWVNSNNKLDGVAIFTFNSFSYNDGGRFGSKVIGGSEEDHEKFRDIMADPYEIFSIRNPSDQMLIAALIGDYGLTKKVIKEFGLPSENVLLAAITQHGDLIKHVPEPSEKLQIAAVSENPNTWFMISNPTYKATVIALTKRPNIISQIKDPSEELQLIAVSNSPDYLGDIRNPTLKVQMTAISKDPYAIAYLKGLDEIPEQVQMAAVKQDPYVIDTIRKPSEKALAYARSKGLKV